MFVKGSREMVVVLRRERDVAGELHAGRLRPMVATKMRCHLFGLSNQLLSYLLSGLSHPTLQMDGT